MASLCKECGNNFVITDEDRAFYEHVSPVIGGKKYLIPSPTRCPDCRLQRRLAFLNQVHVYTRKSSATGKPMFCQFSDATSFPVFENDVWWSDTWDACSYGREIDSSKSFLEQFNALSAVVPHFALMVLRNENCDYCNNVSDNKNCYLIFNTRRSEDCIACERTLASRDCIDCNNVTGSELCCNCISCVNCYAVQDSEECKDCRDSFFLLNCSSCSNCFGCVNLRHKQYCIYNEQKTPEEYAAFLKGLNLASHSERSSLKEKIEKFRYQHPRPHAVMQMTENVSGNQLFECRDVHDSYLVRSGEHLRFCTMVFDNVKDCYDYTTYGDKVELVYESVRCGNGISRLLFCYYCYDNCGDLLYSSFCVSCIDCFGCIGLRKKRYCIFNKQYTKEEYETLVPQLIEQMRASGIYGEFFPMTDSPFSYNHSMAQRYFPFKKEDAKNKGIAWHDSDSVDPATAITADQMPDGVPDEDRSMVVKSAQSGKAFSITSQEIKRYRRLGVPLPRTAYDERMEERARRIGGVRLYDRTCAKTGKPIRTTIAPDTLWTVWDKDVYTSEFGA